MKFLNDDKQDKSVWQIPLCTGSERIKDDLGKKAHSTQKPKTLLHKVILSSTKPDDIILDPFFGTGTTGAVAKELGRNFIGIEKEQKYIDIAKTRIDKIIPSIDEIASLTLEVKPPKVPMKSLIEKCFLAVGQTLFDKHGNEICKVNADGTVSDILDTLSIHKMSAKYLNKSNHNGWDYFFVMNNKQLMPLDELRYQYNRQHNGLNNE